MLPTVLGVILITFILFNVVGGSPAAMMLGRHVTPQALEEFDEQRGFFNPDSPAYRAAAKKALKTLVDAGKIFEINTGAISRGFRTTPYPSAELLKSICSFGGRVTITSDAHSASGLDGMRFGVDQARRGWLEPDDVINTRSLGTLRKLLRRG